MDGFERLREKGGKRSRTVKSAIPSGLTVKGGQDVGVLVDFGCTLGYGARTFWVV